VPTALPGSSRGTPRVVTSAGSTGPLARVENVGHLDAAELRRVFLLVERATEADGVRPLSEAVGLELHGPARPDVRHVLVHVPDAGPEGTRLAGYGHLDTSDTRTGSRAEFVVDPELRRRGVGRLVLRHLLGGSPDQRLQVVAQGDLPAARRLAAGIGYRAVQHIPPLMGSTPIETSVVYEWQSP
jgi:mycothiol synthase